MSRKLLGAGSAFLLALAAGLLSGRVAAADPSPGTRAVFFGQEALKQAGEIVRNAPNNAAIQDILKFSGPQGKQQSPQASRASAHAGPVRRMEIHVSHSMSPAALQAVYETAAVTGAVVVFRGVLPAEAIGDLVREIRDMVDGMSPPPAIEIDPTRFRKFGTESVPRILLTDGDELIASAHGTTDVFWFRDKVDDGALGDLGAFGTTFEVAEKDLIQELQERAAAYDFAAAKRRALASYWRKARFYELPKAKEGQIRYVDSTFVLKREIRLSDGSMIAAAGTRINPLDRLPFTQRLIVFDARDPDQVAFARQAALEVGGNRLVTFISTGLDRERGWDALRDVQNELRGPVYLLPNDLAQRFEIERVPSVIDAERARFRVEEVAVGGVKE